MLKLDKVAQSQINELFDAYVASLSDVYDDYLEYHILNSEFYRVSFDDDEIGYFAIFEATLLTQFYIEASWLHLAQGCFKTILEKFDIKNAYVPTCDQLFLSLAMDFHKKVNLQAYFFTDTDREVPEASFPKSMLKLANLSDAEMIKELSDGFFDDLYQMISDRKIYMLKDEDIYGFGIVEVNRIHKHHRGIGMYTVEKHRQKGVGRSIILHLKDLVHTLGYEPLPGCWYHNYNSKRTLESCGFASRTRLLKIDF